MLMDIGVVAAVALVALSIGYAFGARSVTSRLHAEQSKSKPTSQDEQRKPTNDVKDGEESDGDEGEVADGDLSSVKAGLLEPCKLVRVLFFGLERGHEDRYPRFSSCAQISECRQERLQLSESPLVLPSVFLLADSLTRCR